MQSVKQNKNVPDDNACQLPLEGFFIPENFIEKSSCIEKNIKYRHLIPFNM